MTEPAWLNPTEMRAWTGFLETADRIQRLVELQLREAGDLTMVQYEILHWANERAGSRLCVTQLAELMIGSRSGLSYQLAQLEKAGLLRREPDPEDERRSVIEITDKGHALLAKTAPGHVAAVRHGLIDQLDEEQVAQLADIMDVVRGHLRAAAPLTPPRKRKARLDSA
jgi:DNA-binding MarR family transcriptional regulator